MKRFTAIFITLCLLLGISNLSAFAAEAAEWKKEKPMPTGLNTTSSVSTNDKIYVMGGKHDSVPTKAMFSIDKNGNWNSEPSMPETAVSAVAALVGNKIYVIGGSTDVTYDTSKNTVMIYDIELKTWSYGEPMPARAHYSAAAAVGDQIYVFGGRSAKTTDTNKVYIYDISSDTWKSGADMPHPVYGSRASVVGDKVFVLGGFTTRYPVAETDVNIYHIKSDTWESGNPMPFATSHFGFTANDNEIYVLGGYNDGAINKVAVYDISSGEWKTKTDLPAKVYASAAGRIENKIYSIGGVNENLSTINTVLSLTVEGEIGSNNLLSVLLNIGEAVQLSTSHNLTSSANFTWSSTNEGVATVDGNGKVTAIAEGDTDIYAKSGDGTFNEYIHVKIVEGIADELRLAVHLRTGEKTKLYLAEDANTVTWSSMDESIATIATDGEITAVAKGLAIVKAELNGEIYQMYVRINA